MAAAFFYQRLGGFNDIELGTADLPGLHVAGRAHAGFSTDPAVHDPQDYGAARALGARLRGRGSAGVAYRSVRHPGGECVGLFSPRGASACVHAAYLLYAWDGARFADVYERVAE